MMDFIFIIVMISLFLLVIYTILYNIKDVFQRIFQKSSKKDEPKIQIQTNQREMTSLQSQLKKTFQKIKFKFYKIPQIENQEKFQSIEPLDSVSLPDKQQDLSQSGSENESLNKQQLEKFRIIISMSQRVRQDQVAEYLNLDKKVLFSKLIQWKSVENLPIILDGEYIVVEDLIGFTSALDAQFHDWKSNEISKKGKVQ